MISTLYKKNKHAYGMLQEKEMKAKAAKTVVKEIVVPGRLVNFVVK